MILCREEYAKKINSAVFPGQQGGPLEHVIAGKAVALQDRRSPSCSASASERTVAGAKARRRGAARRRPRRQRAHRRHRRAPRARRPARVRARRPAGRGPPARRSASPSTATRSRSTRARRWSPRGLRDRHPGAGHPRPRRRTTSPRSARSSPRRCSPDFESRARRARRARDARSPTRYPLYAQLGTPRRSDAPAPRARLLGGRGAPARRVRRERRAAQGARAADADGRHRRPGRYLRGLGRRLRAGHQQAPSTATAAAPPARRARSRTSSACATAGRRSRSRSATPRSTPVEGREAFDRPVALQALAQIYPSYVQVVTRADSGIGTLADLKGKRVSVGSPDSGTQVVADRVLDVAKVGAVQAPPARRRGVGACARARAARRVLLVRRRADRGGAPTSRSAHRSRSSTCSATRPRCAGAGAASYGGATVPPAPTGSTRR